MTQEEKQLLLKDLCARLPYIVIASVRGSDEEFQHFRILGVKDGKVWVENDILGVDDFDDVEVVKPYLRPLSSMTEEEKIELKTITKGAIQTIGLEDIVVTTDKGFDWLNAHHFDYRGLIEKGLALEAPTDMYNN